MDDDRDIRRPALPGPRPRAVSERRRRSHLLSERPVRHVTATDERAAPSLTPTERECRSLTQEGGAKNSRAVLSGSRKETPEP
ncbi:hypothetical protein GCM10009836_10790 [Pseudonocardia ailaonensis]|uniref:Uncharacterized protein n=1 Tax=Pseudonocardia ailaonensis TaxID=367279 RepID=A0ABN2MPQ3_9PSEU